MKITNIRCVQYEAKKEIDEKYYEERLVRPVDLYDEFHVAAWPKRLENLPEEEEGFLTIKGIFLIVDTDTMNFEAISNESSMASGGAGIKAAQTVAKAGAKVVLTGNVGPNAFQTLSAAGILVFTEVDGTIKEVVERFKKGKLKETTASSVGSHFGMKAAGRGFGRG